MEKCQVFISFDWSELSVVFSLAVSYHHPIEKK